MRLFPWPSSVQSPSHAFRAYRLFSLKLLDNVRLQVLRLLRASPAVLDLTVLANEELLKVPFDSLQSHKPGLLVLQPLESRVRLVAVDLHTTH